MPKANPNANPTDDNALMALAQQGDREAYNQIVKRHRAAAIAFAYSFLFDVQLAEDAAQDVFVNIYITRARYKPVCAFKTFLFRAVRNKCIDYLRKQKFKTVSLDNIETLAQNISPEEIFLNNENKKFVFELLNNLKGDYKTALYLFAAEGLSYEDIAACMRKTIPQVKILIYRARQKLKSEVAKNA